MYYWKTQELATQIKEDSLSKEQKKNYYLATTIVGILFMYIAIAGGSQDATATLVECLLVLIISVAAINITFKSNGGNEGDDYIARVVMLGFPVLIKVFILSFLAGIILGIVGIALDMPTLFESQWAMTAIGVSMQIFYFWRINAHLRNINEK